MLGTPQAGNLPERTVFLPDDPRRTPKDLAAVPRHVALERRRVPGQGRTNRTTGVLEDHFLDHPGPADPLGHEHAPLLVERDPASVVDGVVEDAERDAVVLGVGTSFGVGTDVGRVDRERRQIEPPVVAADGAPVLVDPEDQGSEHRIPNTPAALAGSAGGR